MFDMKTLLMTAAVALTATTANADGYAPRVQTHLVTILEVTPQYVQVPQQVVQQVCYQENVPVRRHSDGGDVLTGALIGGAIGNQFGGGSGKDAATIVGALLGANVGARSQPIVGYQTVHHCQDQVTTQYVEEFSHFTVIFLDNGRRYRTETTRNFFVGEQVPSAAFY